MGCDGGTIPKRDELVRTKKKGEKKDKISELAFKWKHCAISQEALVKPIVACELGRLYNKESILEFLLDRSKFDVAAQLDHLRGLKDVKELNLTDNPEKRPKDADKGDSYTDPSISDFICPVVGLEMSGTFKFCFIWSCGCVMSERALKEVKTDVCHKCGKSYKDEDVIVLNGTEEEVADMRRNMELRQSLAKLSKKNKRAEKHKLCKDSGEVATSSKQQCTNESETPAAVSVNGQLTTTASTSSNRQESASSKVIKDSRPGIGRFITSNGKSSTDRVGKSKLTNSTQSSIQNDPNASQTFKSLFTSSEDAKSRKQAHWVTYNPLYY
ncbi:protein RTF2 [Biomphalaria pfeifferi]|uniref:Replication termination factor 2 n=1 Tax=Biomphalaria pfeifferi TaxID=112525 RepID=A0AAD8EYD2_BIOPF|nr:protein RTF2 [Biomphalaria pfeifferi]